MNLASPARYLALYANTAADAPSGLAPSSSLALTGSLAPGASLLFKNSASANPTYATGTASGVINFNGDDLVILSASNGTAAWADRLDVVGNGTAWGTDKSFARIATVGGGNPTYTPAEWTPLTLAAVNGAATGTTERLGTHIFGSAPADTQAPTVSATEIGTSGTITFNATATDNVGVTKVEFYVDGVLKGTDTASPYSMTLDSTTLTNAAHSLTAKAYDAASNIGTSTAVSFTISNAVPDTQAPTVSATETGTSGTITFNATATDNVGVTKVEFYVDGVLKGTDTASPYSMTLDSTTLTNAAHSLTAKAYDAASNIGTSTAVSFTISNAVPDTQAPTVSATETGTSGTITFNATATDNVGVTKVEFYVDGVLKGTDTASPYSMTLDSTTLTNAAHSLTAKAYDAASNIGTSTAVSFTINNSVSTTFNEVEANNTQATANAVGATITKIVGYFPSTTDNNDYFNVTLLAGRTLIVDMTGPTASAQDYDLYLLSSTGTQLASSTGSSTTEHVSYKNTNATASKVITIRVNRYASSSSVTPYTLTMSR
ncbi:MAG: pre-peptidase C-terminal domain-containing protein [Holophagaceae bacterium]|nr:pre-peptidase C-terminal domain-containing protein [Holophagaceae bacterium]